MKNYLIFSNCAASNTESNGRIHMTHLDKLLKENKIHNFYIKGNPDVENIEYINVPYKEAFLSKITLGLRKIKLFNNKVAVNSVQNQISSKSKKPFFHWARNFCYSRNRSIYKKIKNYIIFNNIDAFILWGNNVPFLYEYVYKLSKKLNVPIITITCEDYPLKNYNYMTFRKNLFFSIVQQKLKKYCQKVYSISKLNIFTNEELLNLYSSKTLCNNNHVIYFGSSLLPSKNSDNKIENIFYGGNLYEDRLDSLLKLADEIKKKSSAVINIYGNLDPVLAQKISSKTNVKYHGYVSYETLIEHMYNSDCLLHIEGFSKKYINDCRYAFSTKISDYLMLQKPVIVYGSEEISGIKFCVKNIEKNTIISDADFVKLDYIFQTTKLDFNPTNLFSLEAVSEKFCNLASKI